MTPILSPPKAMIVEMSSLLTFSAAGRTNGVPQTASLPSVRFTQIWSPCSQVAQSWPVESFAMVSVSLLTELIVAGKPPSSV